MVFSSDYNTLRFLSNTETISLKYSRERKQELNYWGEFRGWQEHPGYFQRDTCGCRAGTTLVHLLPFSSRRTKSPGGKSEGQAGPLAGYSSTTRGQPHAGCISPAAMERYRERLTRVGCTGNATGEQSKGVSAFLLLPGGRVSPGAAARPPRPLTGGHPPAPPGAAGAGRPPAPLPARIPRAAAGAAPPSPWLLRAERDQALPALPPAGAGRCRHGVRGSGGREGGTEGGRRRGTRGRPLAAAPRRG